MWHLRDISVGRHRRFVQLDHLEIVDLRCYKTSDDGWLCGGSLAVRVKVRYFEITQKALLSDLLVRVPEEGSETGL